MMRGGRLVAAMVAMTSAACAPASVAQRTATGTLAGPAMFVLEGERTQGGVLLGTAPADTVALTLDGKPVPVAPDGRFLIAFDRDAGPVATLVATRRSGPAIVEAVTVAPRAWRIERLPTLPRVAQPSAEFQRRRPAELAAIAAARADSSGTVEGWRQRFIWPTTGRISGLFGAQRIYAGEPGAYHSGVDIARAEGTPLVAPADGIVILAADAPFTLEGNLLMLDHGMGLNSAFLHLSRIAVRPGQRVRQGDLIGYIGATGRATGPHMHWGMKWNDSRIDPLLVVGGMVAG